MFLRYNTATEIDFFMPDATDPWIGKTGLTSITVAYKKQGQSSFTTLSSPTITEIGNGWYKLSVPTAMTDTYGFLVIRFSATGAKAQQQLYQVVAFNPYDSAGLGLSRIDAAISSRSTLTTSDVQTALTNQGYTSTRAGYLDRLDVNVSSRMPSGNVTVGGYASGQDPATLVWNYVVEASQSALSWMRLMGATLFGKRVVSGGTESYRDWNDTKNRVVGSVDDSGNRSITTRDGS